MLPYERFEAWKLCDALALAVYGATRGFPKNELYGLTSQLRRAAFSAAANIAEGSAKVGAREFCRYLNISIGSLSELAYALSLCRRLGLLAAKECEQLDELRRRAGYLTWRLYRAVQRGARKMR